MLTPEELETLQSQETAAWDYYSNHVDGCKQCSHTKRLCESGNKLSNLWNTVNRKLNEKLSPYRRQVSLLFVHLRGKHE